MTRTSGRSIWQCDPFRSPQWRWEHALQPRLSVRRALKVDPAVSIIRQYQQAFAAAKTDPQRLAVDERWPDLADAHAIYRGGGVLRDEVEARLLAGEPLPDISGKTSLPASVLEVYASTFFDVRHSLSAFDWLMNEAIGTIAWRDREPMDGDVLRYLGLAAGIAMVDALTGRDGQPREVRDQLWKKARVSVRAFAATMWPASYDLPAIMAEEQLVFSDVILRECVGNNNRLLATQLNFVRSVHGLQPLPGIGADLPADERADAKPLTPNEKVLVVTGQSFGIVDAHGDHELVDSTGCALR